MKRIYLLFLFIIFLRNGFTQSCISLGCAAPHTGLVTDGTLPDSLVSSGLGCYNGNALKQIFWEYFFSPTGGNFTQTFTPTSGTNLAINYVIFDEGAAVPSAIDCPVSTAGWTQIACDITDHPNQPTGPGLFSVTASTVTGHYYAIAIILWQGTNNGGDASYTFNTSIPQLGGVDLTGANCPGVLPVNLSSFTGNVTNCIINLNWTAASQIDLKNYEVQYSADGVNFNTLTTLTSPVQGTGQDYSYNHISPAAGDNYYRLKMTDKDGTYQYSKVIILRSSCNNVAASVYPNPVGNTLYIHLPDLQNDITVAHLYNSEGKMIYSGTMQNGTNAVNMTTFPKGVYLLTLKTNSEIQNIKVIK